MIPWYKSKQFWFNSLTVIAAVATALLPDDYTPDPRIATIAYLVIAIANVALRFVIPSQPPPARLEQIKGGVWDFQPPTTTYRRTNLTAAVAFTVLTAATITALLIAR